MAGIAICNYEECPRKENCFRHNNQGELIDFQHICNEETQYKWFWEKMNTQDLEETEQDENTINETSEETHE